MGNTISLQKEPEDQESVRVTAYSQVSSEPPANLQNGSVPSQPIETFPSANGDAVDARVSVAQDNVAVSSQKTMEISSVSQTNGNNLGKEAKTALPAAKSRFVFAFSRPVPGRTEEQATNASVGSAQLDVSSEATQANKASSENLELPAAAALEGESDKNLNEASLSEIELTAPAEAEESTVPKQKELTFFDRLFKLEKGKEKTKTGDQSQGEEKAEDLGVLITVEDRQGLQSTPEHAPQGKDVIDECNQNISPQNSEGVNCLASEDLPQEEVKPDSARTTAGTDYNNAVMSFFKTLVSPSKADSKAESEDKAKKETQEVANTKATGQTVVTTTVKSETNIPPLQESPGGKANPKAPEPPVQPPATATVVVTNETPKEVTKERSSSTPTPLSKFFWKKTPTDDIEVINTERIEPSPEAPVKDESRSQEAAEAKSKGDEKPSKTNLRKFFKLSVKNEPGATVPEEVNEQPPIHQTLDFKDKPLAQAENPEPVSKKSHESSTEKLNKQQESKQEAKGPSETREQEPAETASLQNGGEATKENTPKRTEKRQSFGGFFKGLSPKRMSDAEVQTDPVSIVPVVKPK